MVRSSMSEAERRAWRRVIGLGFLLVVGGSAGMMALAGGASVVETAVVTGLGLATGGGLVWYLASLSVGGGRREHRRR